jgi:hypothetical protein
MKKLTISITMVCVALVLILQSCKEEVLIVEPGNSALEKIDAWFEKQKKPGRTFRNKKIQELRDNLDLPNLKMEMLNKNNQVMMIPVMRKYRPGTMGEENAVHTMILFVDNTGKIIRGNVVEIESDDKSTTRPSQYSLVSNHFNSRPITNKARIAILDAGGFLLYETKYEKGKVKSIGVAKSAPVSQSSSARITCYQWTLTLTIYYDDGSTEVFVSDLGVTCEGNETVQVPMPDEGSGDPDPNGNCCIPDPNIQFFSSPESNIVSQNCTEYVRNGKQFKTCFYSWVFSTNTLLMYTWKYVNYIRAELEKEGGVWKFVSLVSSGSTMDGAVPPCISSNVSTNWITNTISADRRTAVTRINFTVSILITCVPWSNPIYATNTSMAQWVA